MAFALMLSLSISSASAQERLSLRECLDYALEHNLALRKGSLSSAAARQSLKEVTGALMPQVSASSGISYNMRKTTVAMPNFMNSMLPEAMRDPYAPKYITVTMGMDWNASWGAVLSQQILNFPLFNALDIARLGVRLSEMGEETDREEIIAQTASLYWSILILSYAVERFDESIALMDRTGRILETSGENGLARPVDIRQIAVNRTNLEAEKESMMQAVVMQKNLLKFRMGFQMDGEIELAEMDEREMERWIFRENAGVFDVSGLLPFRIFKSRQKMLDLQYRSSVYEMLPALSLNAHYNMNYMGDRFRGETFRHFPVSALSLNLRVPIFTGMSKSAGIKKAKIEKESSLLEEEILTQSLSMAYGNAQSSLEQSLKTMESQRRNRDMARELFAVVESNYMEGLASLADLLNADAALIRAQMNYVNALGGCMKAYVELKKADGTIYEITR